jgi:hypothetical protein
MKTHLQTIVLICILAIVLTGIRFFPGVILGVIIFIFVYAFIYESIKETPQTKKEHENGKG